MWAGSGNGYTEGFGEVQTNTDQNKRWSETIADPPRLNSFLQFKTSKWDAHKRYKNMIHPPCAQVWNLNGKSFDSKTMMNRPSSCEVSDDNRHEMRNEEEPQFAIKHYDYLFSRAVVNSWAI